MLYIFSNIVHKMNNTSYNKGESVENVPQSTNRIKNAKIRFETTNKIIDAIHSQQEKDEKNSSLFELWVETLIDRAYPLNWDSQDKKEISEIDWYYIPDTRDPIIQELLQSDNKIYEILNGILCRPQFFWRNRKTKEWIITKEWLDRLNYILNMAAKHTLRHIEEASLMHTIPASNDKNPGFWEPTFNSNLHKTNKGKLKPWYNYFKDKLRNFTTSQRGNKDKKNKIYFNIRTKEEFCQLVRALIVDYIPVVSGWSQIYPAVYESTNGEHSQWDIRFKPLSTRIKDWLFLKNISCFADMERSDVYTWKRTHFPQIIREVYEPLLQIHKPQDSNKDKVKGNKSQKSKLQKSPERNKKELNNHEIEYSKTFNIDYKYNEKEKIAWKFVLCTKSQNSMLDKTRRDVTYSTLTDLKDMIRWSFIMKDHHDVISMLHYYIKYFVQNPERNFDHNPSGNAWFDPQNWVLRWLELRDKWILNTEIAQWIEDLNWLPKWKKPKEGKDPSNFTDDELNWAATNFILNSISDLPDKKSSNSTKYIDTKLIVPTLMRPNPLPMEIKFLTKENYENNERGLAHHDIMRLKQNIKLRCRDEKFILADKIKREIELLLQKNPELKAQIESELIANNRGSDNTDAAEEIYKDIQGNLFTIKGEYGENWFEPTIFCDKEIWKHLKNGWFTYSPDDIKSKEN